MNELDQKLIESIDSIKTFLTSSEVLEQTTDLINQVISYYTWMHSIWMVLGLIITTSTFGFYKLYKMSGNFSGSFENMFELVFMLGSVMSVIIGPMLFLINLMYLIQITVAPKIWLIEYISNLLT
jgi:hypothetical protein